MYGSRTPDSDAESRRRCSFESNRCFLVRTGPSPPSRLEMGPEGDPMAPRACGECPGGHRIGALAASPWPGVDLPESGGVSKPPLKQTADSDLPRGREESPRPNDSARAGSIDVRSTFENDLHAWHSESVSYTHLTLPTTPYV